jgi:hypothetical protein
MEVKFKAIENLIGKEKAEKLKAFFSGEETTETVEETKEEKVETKFEEAVLKDGSVILYDGELGVGVPVFVRTEEGDIEAPNGDYDLEDGRLVVVEGGLVVEVKGVEEEVEEELSNPLADAVQSLTDRVAQLESKFDDEQENRFKTEMAEMKETVKLVFEVVTAMGEEPSEEPTEKSEYKKVVAEKKTIKDRKLASIKNYLKTKKQ